SYGAAGGERNIAVWLEKIFGPDHPIPQYEVNPRTTEILHHLSEHNRDVYLVIEDLKQKASEYQSERISRKQSCICLQKGPKLIIVIRAWTF
uniref:Uncharacterized protein n=1 Tax=Pan troglodytes TaxID=9598 RepID=A0A2I3TEB4_PANTR